MFPITNWNDVVVATLNGDPEGRAALGRLCNTYLPVIEAFVRSRGIAHQDSKDITQDFFLRMLQKALWKKADPSRGRFSTFLRVVIKHMILNQWAKGDSNVSLDKMQDDGFEPAGGGDECPEFDVMWADRVLDSAYGSVKALWIRRGNEREFAVLRQYLLSSTQPPPYERLVGELGTSEQAIRAAVYRLRCEMRQALRTEVTKTVNSEAEVDEELDYLFKVLTQKGALTFET